MILAVMLLIAFAFTGCGMQPVTHQYGQQILSNGNFEQWNGTTPDGWRFVSDCGGTLSRGQHNTASDFASGNGLGEQYITITNPTYGTSYLAQTLQVQPGATYLVEAFIKIDTELKKESLSTVPGCGAKVGFLEDMGTKGNGLSGQGFTSTTGWKYKYELNGNEREKIFYFYFTTELDVVNIYVALGDEITPMSGTANFDGVSVKKICTTPPAAGEEADPTYLAYKADVQDTIYTCHLEESIGWTQEGALYFVIGTLLTIAVGIAVYLLVGKKFIDKTYVSEGNLGEQILAFIKTNWVILTVGVLAIAVRIILAAVFAGNRGETEYLVALGSQALGGGFTTLYASGSDAGPLTYYIATLAGILAQGSSGAVMATAFLAKVPMMLADIATCAVIYCIVRKYAGKTKGAICAGFYALLPATSLASAVWATTDSFLVLFVAIAVSGMLDKKVVKTIVGTALALAISPQAVVMLPIVIATVIVACMNERAQARKALIAAVASVLGIYVIALPIMVGANALEIFTKYFNAVISFSGFNMTGIIADLTWAGIVSAILNVLYAGAIGFVVVRTYLIKKNRLFAVWAMGFSYLAFAFFTTDAGRSFMLPAILLVGIYAFLKADKNQVSIAADLGLIHFIYCAFILGESGCFTSYLSGMLTSISPSEMTSIVLAVAYFAALIAEAFSLITSTKKSGADKKSLKS